MEDLIHWGCRWHFKCIFLNENLWILIKISLKFVPKGPINNIRALVQIMGWCRPGNKPLSEAVMLSLLHICVTWPQWVKPQTSTSQPSVSYITRCGLVKLYDDIDLRQHWFRQWLVAWWHQAITWTNVHHQWRSVTITWGQFRKKYRSLPSVTKMSLKITYMKFHSNLPGANELRLS